MAAKQLRNATLLNCVWAITAIPLICGYASPTEGPSPAPKGVVTSAASPSASTKAIRSPSPEPSSRFPASIGTGWLLDSSEDGSDVADSLTKLLGTHTEVAFYGGPSDDSGAILVAIAQTRVDVNDALYYLGPAHGKVRFQGHTTCGTLNQQGTNQLACVTDGEPCVMLMYSQTQSNVSEFSKEQLANFATSFAAELE
jgi:hypothetical protein